MVSMSPVCRIATSRTLSWLSLHTALIHTESECDDLQQQRQNRGKQREPTHPTRLRAGVALRSFRIPTPARPPEKVAAVRRSDPARRRGQGERRRVRADWIAQSASAAISGSSEVMSFEHKALAFNLLDTPGHQVSARVPIRT